MDYYKLTKLLYNRADIVCWPPFGSGNAMMKCLTLHDPYIYNPDWNMWGPLEYILQPPPTFNAKVFKSHYADIWGEHTLDISNPIIPQLAKVLEQKQPSPSELQWARQVLDENKRVVYGPMHHIPSKHMLRLTKNPIVQLIPRDYESMITRPYVELGGMFKKSTQVIRDHFEVVDHPQILNIYTEDFFYATHEVFMREYTRLRDHFNLEDRSEQVWAFVLYYQDRVRRTRNTNRLSLEEFNQFVGKDKEMLR